MVERSPAARRCPSRARQDRRRTDGMPLFVEELTKTVLEAVLRAMTARTTSSRAVPGRRHPRYAAGLADGAARPARSCGEGDGADRRRDRPRIRPRSRRSGRALRGGVLEAALEQLVGGGDPRAGPAAGIVGHVLRLPPRPDPGSRLPVAAAGAPPPVPCPDRRSPHRGVPRDRRRDSPKSWPSTWTAADQIDQAIGAWHGAGESADPPQRLYRGACATSTADSSWSSACPATSAAATAGRCRSCWRAARPSSRRRDPVGGDLSRGADIARRKSRPSRVAAAAIGFADAEQLATCRRPARASPWSRRRCAATTTLAGAACRLTSRSAGR